MTTYYCCKNCIKTLPPIYKEKYKCLPCECCFTENDYYCYAARDDHSEDCFCDYCVKIEYAKFCEDDNNIKIKCKICKNTRKACCEADYYIIEKV